MNNRGLIPPSRPATGALMLETYALTKRFGSLTAMDHVSIRVEPGTVHAEICEPAASAA